MTRDEFLNKGSHYRSVELNRVIKAKANINARFYLAVKKFIESNDERIRVDVPYSMITYIRKLKSDLILIVTRDYCPGLVLGEVTLVKK